MDFMSVERLLISASLSSLTKSVKGTLKYSAIWTKRRKGTFVSPRSIFVYVFNEQSCHILFYSIKGGTATVYFSFAEIH